MLREEKLVSLYICVYYDYKTVVNDVGILSYLVLHYVVLLK